MKRTVITLLNFSITLIFILVALLIHNGRIVFKVLRFSSFYYPLCVLIPICFLKLLIFGKLKETGKFLSSIINFKYILLVNITGLAAAFYFRNRGYRLHHELIPYVIIFNIIWIAYAVFLSGKNKITLSSALITSARILSVGLLLFIVPLKYYFEIDNTFLIFLFIFTVSSTIGLGFSLVNFNKEGILRKWVNDKTALFIISLFGLYYISICFLNYYSFNTGGDLAHFNHIFQNTVKGRFFYSDYLKCNFLAHHFSPILAFFLPFYFLVPDPRTLLITKCIVFSLAPWFLYLLARDITKSRLLGLVLAVAYFMAPLELEDLFTDFHMAYLFPFFIISSIYCLLKNKTWMYLLSILLLLLCKEDTFIYVFGIGLFTLFFYKKMKLGLSTIFLSIFYPAVTLGYLKPLVGGFAYLERDNWIAQRYSYLGANFKEVFSNIIFHSVTLIKNFLEYDFYIKLKSLCFILIPVVFLPVLTISGMVLLLPAVMEMFLSSKSWIEGLRFHYSLAIYAFTFVATVFGSYRLIYKMKWPRWRGVCPSVSQRTNFCVSFIISAGLMTNYCFSYWTPAEHFDINKYTYRHKISNGYKALEKIPPEQTVTAQIEYGVHLMKNNPNVYLRNRTAPIPDEADYVLLDEKEMLACTLFKMLYDGNFGVFYRNDNFLILKKGYKVQRNSSFFREFFSVIEGETLPHITGINIVDNSASLGMARIGRFFRDGNGFLAFQNFRRYPSGLYKAKFYLKTDDNKPEGVVAAIDVVAVLDKEGKVLAQRKLKGPDFRKPGIYQCFELNFDHSNEEEPLEFRVFYIKNMANIWFDRIEVESPSFNLKNCINLYYRNSSSSSPGVAPRGLPRGGTGEL